MNEMPVIKQIHTGPYHCAALTDDGRVFVWGKGKYGVLGQGTEENHYEPVQVQMEPNFTGKVLPAKLFITGEYHSLVVQEADRHDMQDNGYHMRTVPNSEDFVCIPEKNFNAEDLASRFRTDQNVPVERYDSQGRTSKGQFNNVLDITEAGKIVVDKGFGTEEVEPDDVNPARAKSLRGENVLHPPFLFLVLCGWCTLVLTFLVVAEPFWLLYIPIHVIVGSGWTW